MANIYSLAVAILIASSSAFPHLAQRQSLGSTVGSTVGGLTTTLLGGTAAPDASKYPWQAPTASDVRSPCPGINTFANHGYLPRSGKDISLDTMVSALELAVNFSPNFALSFAQGAFTAAGVPLGGNLSLDGLTATALNHRAAMFHSDDTVNKGGDVNVNTTMVQQMLSDSLPPFQPAPADYLDSTTLAATHIRRLRETGKGLLVVNLDLPDEPKETAECALFLLAFAQIGADGNPANVASRRFPKVWAQDWLVANRIPTGWVRSSIAWQQTDFVTLTALVETNSQAINTANVASKL